MSATSALPMFLQFFNPNNSGAPAVGFQLFTYQAGTTTKQATWTDSSQGTQNANPLALDANGRAIVWGDPTLSYKFVLAPLNSPDPPTSPVWTQDDIEFPLNLSVLTQAVIGSILYPQTPAEALKGVAPTNTEYDYGHILRYVPTSEIPAILAGTSALDCSTYAQNWLTVLEPGMTATLVGTVRAQGLIVLTSDIRFAGGGWLKPVSNVAASVLQLGQDSSETAAVRISGALNIGDTGGVAGGAWSSVTGLECEYCYDCTLDVSACGLGIGIDFSPTYDVAGYNTFRLGDMINNTVAIRFNPTSAGDSNENTFIGGRFTLNSGTYSAGCAYIQGLKAAGSNSIDGIRFYAPTFEGAGQVLNWGGIGLRIHDARWEPDVSGTAGVNYANPFWNFTSDAERNRVDFAYHVQWLDGDATIEYSSGLTAPFDDEFEVAGSDQTAFFAAGTLVRLTISGTDFLATVTSSAYAGGNTTVNILQPVLTAAPSAVYVASVNDAGLQDAFEAPFCDVTGLEFAAEMYFKRYFSMIKCALAIGGYGADNPALTLTDLSSNANDVLRVVDSTGTGAKCAGLTSNGALTIQALTINTAATTGTATASFAATNKPGSDNKTSPDKWITVILDGTTYYIPAFAS